MKLAIMQPYFLPYLGYWQLMNAADLFVVYDDIQFTKKGWIHRNQFLQNGKDLLFSLSLKKDSDYLNISDRFLSESNGKNIDKIIRQLENSYNKAPYYTEIMPLLLQCFRFPEKNLFYYILNSINLVREYMGISTPIVISSELAYDNNLKSQNKVLDLCRVCNSDVYINTLGGKDLYEKPVFANKGTELKFIKMGVIEYRQFNNVFIPGLSIVDVLMFNPVVSIIELLDNYTLE